MPFHFEEKNPIRYRYRFILDSFDPLPDTVSNVADNGIFIIITLTAVLLVKSMRWYCSNKMPLHVLPVDLSRWESFVFGPTGRQLVLICNSRVDFIICVLVLIAK